MDLTTVRILFCVMLPIVVRVFSQSQTFRKGDLDLSGIHPEIGFHPNYRDVFILGESNFTDCVMRSRDPWVVIPFAGGDLEHWKGLAERMRGVAFFGTIDITQEANLLSELNFPVQSSVGSRTFIARVYPYGKANIKERQSQDIDDLDDVPSLIIQSLPSDTMTSVGTDEELNDFLMNCLLDPPTKFPILFIVDQDEAVPASFISISNGLQRYFSFSRVDTPLAWSLLQGLDSHMHLGEEDISRSPGLVAITAHFDNGTFSYKVSKYSDVESSRDLGEDDTLSYFNIFKFLFRINSQYRQFLPGGNMAEDEEVLFMKDAIEAERKRFRFITKRSKVYVKDTKQSGSVHTSDL